MKSLFNPTNNQEILDRINKLTPESKTVWGKMQVNQMLAHSQLPLKVAFGELKLKRGLIGVIFGGMAKRSLLKDEGFKQNLPTSPQFIIRDFPKFDEEKTKLIALVKRFADQGPNAISKEPHPFFGRLTIEEWDKLQWKHLDHHLRQFGV